jgi:hypothetical protein
MRAWLQQMAPYSLLGVNAGMYAWLCNRSASCGVAVNLVCDVAVNVISLRRLPLLLGAKMSSRITARALRTLLAPPPPAPPPQEQRRSSPPTVLTKPPATTRSPASRTSSPRQSFLRMHACNPTYNACKWWRPGPAL